MEKRHLVLASASPARRRTLAAAGIDPEVVVSGVNESGVNGGPPELVSLTLARLKAHDVADRLRRDSRSAPSTLVLGADSILAFQDEALGKPTDPAEAIARWRRMRGREGVLHTGHCVVDFGTGKTAEATSSTTIRFADVTDAEIDAYVATGEPLCVAGAFTIDGIGGPFIDSIDGDPGTVIGLSLPLLRHLLARLGISITTLWRDELTSSA